MEPSDDPAACLAALEAERSRLAVLAEAERARAAEAALAHAGEIERLQGALARARKDLAALREYGRALEAKHLAVLQSETWRAMAPVRRVLRALRGRRAPDPFVPRLGDDAASVWGHIENLQQSRRTALVAADPAVARSDRVVAFLATYPARREKLAAVVAAILPQCDALCVYLNGYDAVPDCLGSEKVTATLGRHAAGDLKDNGKFYHVARYPDAYHVFIDDDIVYPPDYVRRLVEGIGRFGFRFVVGFHGVIYNEPVGSYLRDRTVLSFDRACLNTLVDQLGTGTAACHGSTFAADLPAFETPGVSDLWFARLAAERGVPLVALERPGNWLRDMDAAPDTLFRGIRRDDARESALLRDRLAPALRRGPRAPALNFLRALYTPAHLAAHGVDLEASASGAFGAAGTKHRSDVHFAIIVVGWNCAGFVEPCLASIEHQIPGDFTFDVHVYDDASEDGTWEAIRRSAAELNLRTLRGARNMGPAFARDVLLRQVADPATVCVLLDMDDQLLPHALATLEGVYRRDADTWMTYGTWIDQNGKLNAEGAYDAGEIDRRDYRRSDVFRFTHLRSFRRFLYDRVGPAHLQDEDGRWLRHCSDVGLMLPLADQCSSRNVVALSEPVYRYTQHRAEGTQKRFGKRKKQTFRYLRDNAALFAFADRASREDGSRAHTG